MGQSFFCIAPMAGATAHTPNSLRGRQPHSRRAQDSRGPGRTLGQRWTGAGVRPGLSLSPSVWRGGGVAGAGPGWVAARSTSRAGGGSPGAGAGGRDGAGGQTPKNPEVRPETDTPLSKTNPFPQRGSQRHMGGEPKTDTYLTFSIPFACRRMTVGT